MAGAPYYESIYVKFEESQGGIHIVVVYFTNQIADNMFAQLVSRRITLDSDISKTWVIRLIFLELHSIP